MNDVRAALAAGTKRLVDSDTPRLDAELLMAHVLGCSRGEVLLRYLDANEPVGFAPLIARRAAGEPIAYLIGRREFWTIELAVGPGVLIPRADSETLIEAAQAHFTGRAPMRVLDLGTGPGTLLLAVLAEWRDATGLGVDASATAIDYAKRNAQALGFGPRARFRLGDWAGGIDERFDLILANPPYIGTDEEMGPGVREHEPGEALFGGADGLDAYRTIVPDLPRLLAPGGAAVLEIGWRQADAVSTMVRAVGLSAAVRTDLGGRPRAVVAT